jgi:hypothetical protein
LINPQANLLLARDRKYNRVISTKAAKALGLTVPPRWSLPPTTDRVTRQFRAMCLARHVSD